MPSPPVAGIRGRRSAGLPVGAAADWACGLGVPVQAAPPSTNFLPGFNVQVLGRLRQGAVARGGRCPPESLDPSPRAGARAAAAQVRCQAPPLAPCLRGQVETAHTRPLITRPPERAPCHPDPALAPPIRPLTLAPLPCAICRAQIGLHVSLPDARRQGGGDFRTRGERVVDADNQSQPMCECNPAPSHPAAPRVASRAHLRDAHIRRPAEAEGPRCARAGHRLSGRGSYSSTSSWGSAAPLWFGPSLDACLDASPCPRLEKNGSWCMPVLGRRARSMSVGGWLWKPSTY